MATIGLLFPGQGSQSVGMGQGLIDTLPVAKSVYEQADQILGFSLSNIMLQGPEIDLKKTDIAQPAILTASAAAWQALNDKVTIPAEQCICAGHSLGEYSALMAADVFSFETALRLVRKRGQLMQSAAEQTAGGMAAVIGRSEAEVREICQRADSQGGVQVANLNCPGQVVVSGSKTALDVFMLLAKEQKIKVIPLAVAGAFHSRFMQTAADQLSEVLTMADFQIARIPVVANVTVEAVAQPVRIRELLIQQVTGSVRWEDTIRHMINAGVKLMLEIGPGKVLQGLVKKIDPSVNVLGVFSADEIEMAAQTIKQI